MRLTARKRNQHLVCALLAISLGGCLSGGGGSDDASVVNPGNPSSNTPPTISGSPPPLVLVGQSYSFTPTASDADGDTLTFSVSNLPAWASFDTSTGKVSGTAPQGSEGVFSGIVISVSDGKVSSSLPQFAIEVTQTAPGSATLSWVAPTVNDDGTALTDLAAYTIYIGQEPGNYTDAVTIDNPGLTTYVVDNLVPNTYYFAVTAINADGRESRFSNEAIFVLN
jgi:hypothetical protein